MSGARKRRTQRWMLGAVAAFVLAAAPIGASGSGSVAAVPVGASGSTVYMSVSNLSPEPSTATLNLSVTSGLTTLVGSTTVALAPMATATVPVSMSGNVSKLSLSSSLKVSVIDTQDPFCH